MKCSLGISNYLEEISSLPHSVVFLYFLHWSLRKAFLSLLAILWNSAFRYIYLSFSPLLFTSLLLTAIYFMTNRRWKGGGSDRFLLLGSKITVDGDCSHEIRRQLLLGRKEMTNLDSVLRCRDITLLTKVHIVNGMVFPAVMYGCKSWTVKKAEH